VRPGGATWGTAGTTIMRALLMSMVAAHPNCPSVSVLVAAMHGVAEGDGRLITTNTRTAHAPATSAPVPRVSQRYSQR